MFHVVVIVISLISDFFLLDFANFLDFVVIDVEDLSIEVLSIKLLYGKNGIIWDHEANESKVRFSFFAEDLDAFDFSALSEVFSELFFGCAGWEVLNVNAVSLL